MLRCSCFLLVAANFFTRWAAAAPPSATPSFAPSSTPAPTTNSSVEFESVLTFYGASANYFDNSVAQDAVCDAMTKSMSIDFNDCLFAGWTTTAPTRKLTSVGSDHQRKLLEDPVYVTTFISTSLAALGYTPAEISTAFLQLSDDFVGAISSGSFLALFQTYATSNALPVPTGFDLSPEVFFNTDYVILYPSSVPTSVPTSAPSYTEEAQWGQVVWDGRRRTRRAGSGMCENSCSGHGTCDMSGKQDCTCYTNLEGVPEWTGPDCSLRTCRYDFAWVGDVVGANDLHPWAECSNKGICNRVTGECECFTGYDGVACQRTVCPEDCNYRGICWPERRLAEIAGRVYLQPWDARKHVGCVCDKGYRGPSCALQECPSGADPLGGYGNEAGRDCSGRGICDYNTGTCSCFSGFYGANCDTVTMIE